MQMPKKGFYTVTRESKDEGIYILIRAVIKRACMDYMRMNRPGKPRWVKEGMSKEKEKEKIEDWLRNGEIMALYSDVDPEYLIEHMKKGNKIISKLSVKGERNGN